MAVPSLRSRSNANSWAAKNKQREEQNKPQEEKKEKSAVSQEEHEARINLLREMGLLKE